MKKQKADISDLVRHYQKFGSVILLESQKKDHIASQKSYLAAKPVSWIKSSGKEITLFEDSSGKKAAGNPWDELQAFKGRQKDWLFGYLGYELKNFTESVKSVNERIVELPDMYFMVPGVLIEIGEDGTLTYLKGEEEVPVRHDGSNESFTINESSQTTKDDYLKKVRIAKRQIFEGDFYEINLSHPLEYRFDGNPFALFTKMKERGPVPFAAFLAIEDFCVCSSSPERFLSRNGSIVHSQPIKGTSSSNGEPDVVTRSRLQNSEKERAENLMIVDLVRNDLNRFAIKGTVEVKELFEIQSFETVHQMVSTIECEVDDKTDSIDVIKSCFPMGSMTGAPKISAMKAIDEIEDYKRGIYSGAIGYLTPKGDFDFNVVIRTAIIKDNMLVYPTGGAITSDSKPEEEWIETFIKARALTDSI